MGRMGTLEIMSETLEWKDHLLRDRLVRSEM